LCFFYAGICLCYILIIAIFCVLILIEINNIAETGWAWYSTTPAYSGSSVDVFSNLLTFYFDFRKLWDFLYRIFSTLLHQNWTEHWTDLGTSLRFKGSVDVERGSTGFNQTEHWTDLGTSLRFKGSIEVERGSTGFNRTEHWTDLGTSLKFIGSIEVERVSTGFNLILHFYYLLVCFLLFYLYNTRRHQTSIVLFGLL
jgi:hypothetical protein